MVAVICRKCAVTPVSATSGLSIFFGWAETKLIVDNDLSNLIF